MKTLIIAEAGVNHNGDINRAIALVQTAAQAGADVVKFQTFKANRLASSTAGLAGYQQQNLGSQTSQREMLQKLELKFEDHHLLIAECKKQNINFLSTAFDFESLEFLKNLKLGLWKIPSGEITNLPYLEIIAKLNERTILSTGMSEFSEVQAAVDVLKKSGLSREKLVVLHCNTDYPTQMTDVNLRAMVTMGKDLNVDYGYSDHTLGIEVPIAAVALGASVIEKHFTLDRTLPGPDHKASLEPAELKQMITAIRNTEAALGSSVKKPTASELKNRDVARKSIVTTQAIKKGEVFTTDNLTTQRPGGGMSPMRWHEIISTQATRDYQEGELL